MDDEDRELAALNPLERAQRAGTLLEAHRTRVGQLAKVRTEAVNEARKTMRIPDIAQALGVSRQQVYRVLRGLH